MKLTIAKVRRTPIPAMFTIGRREVPTNFLVMLEGVRTYRRVYVFNVSNNGTAFVKFKGKLYKLDSSGTPAQGDTLSLWEASA